MNYFENIFNDCSPLTFFKFLSYQQNAKIKKTNFSIYFAIKIKFYGKIGIEISLLLHRLVYLKNIRIQPVTEKYQK